MEAGAVREESCDVTVAEWRWWLRGRDEERLQCDVGGGGEMVKITVKVCGVGGVECVCYFGMRMRMMGKIEIIRMILNGCIEMGRYL